MYRNLSSIALCLYLYLCGTPPPDLNLSMTWPTVQGLYAVDLPPLAEPVPVNRPHSRKVRITSPGSQPLLNAEIGVSGDMPQHGHGRLTQPRVTREFGEGHHPVESMRFSMTGRQELQLNVCLAGGDTAQVASNRLTAPMKPSDA